MYLKKLKDTHEYTLKEYMLIVGIGVIIFLCAFFDIVVLVAAMTHTELWILFLIIPITLLGAVCFALLLYIDPKL